MDKKMGICGVCVQIKIVVSEDVANKIFDKTNGLDKDNGTEVTKIDATNIEIDDIDGPKDGKVTMLLKIPNDFIEQAVLNALTS